VAGMEETKGSKKNAADWLYALFVPAVFLLLVNYVVSTPYIEITFLNPTVVMVLLFIAAFILESRYMPYVGLLPSALILYGILEYDWSTIPELLKIYAELGLVLCASSFIVYYKKNGKGPLYNAAFLLYSLKTVFPIYLSFFIFGSFMHPYFLYSFILFTIVSWAVCMEAGM
jgi:hypothetical protein